MEKLIKDTVLRRDLGMSARSLVEKEYSLEVLVRKFYDVLNTI